MRRLFIGIWIVTFCASGMAQVSLKKTLGESKHKLICTAYSPDGKYIGTGGVDNSVIIWDALSGNLVRKLGGLKGFPISLCFDSKSKWIAAGGKDRSVTVWDVASGTLKYSIKAHSSDVLALTFAPDGKYLASAGIDHVIKLWDADNGSLIKELKGHEDQVNCIDFNQSSDRLISGSADKSIMVWDVNSGNQIKKFIAHTNWVRDVIYSPDQKIIASCGDDKIINLWDATTYELKNTLRAHKNIVMNLSFSPDGKYLISGGHDNQIVLFDLNSGSILFQSPKQENYILSVDFDPLGKNFVSVSLYSEELKMWDASALKITPDDIEAANNAAVTQPVVTKPPSVSWIMPAQPSMDVTTAVISIEADIQNASDLNSIEVYINDKLYATDKKEDLAGSIANNSLAYKRNVFLKSGENKIKLIASNAAGSVNSDSKTVVYKLPQKPQISWLTPAAGPVTISSPDFNIATAIASNSDIQKVEIYINSAIASTDYNIAISESNDYIVNFEKSLALNEGINRVEIVATNNAGSTYSTPIEINYSSRQKVTDVDYKAPPNPYRFALIIGNEDYSSYQVDLKSESDVEFAKHDAESFHEYAIKYLGVPEDQAILKTNARYIEMKRELKKISGVIEMTNGKAEVFFYYAGHGFPDEKTKEPYLVPVDGSGTDLEFSAIKLDEVYAALTDFPSKRVTVFIDACFSGGGRNQGLIEARAVKVKPKEVQLQSKLVVFTASSGDETSLPYKEKEHGMFTYFLLQKIEESKANITYKELSDYIREQVGVKSYLVNSKKQEPRTNISPTVIGEWETWKLR